MTNIAIQRKISDIILEYNDKKSKVLDQIKIFEKAGVDLNAASCVGGTYGQVTIDTGKVYDRTLYESLLKSSWLNIHNGLNMKTLMSAKDQKQFDRMMSAPPEFDMDNIRAKFGDYILDPWGNILRGLAEVFCDLDQSYKSHEKVKIGVKGLPKRIIISGFGGYSSWGWNKLADIVNALAAYQGKSLTSHWDIKSNIKKDENYYLENHYDDSGDDVVNQPERGFSLRLFKNGNGHMIFTPDTLKDINRALAEYYGEVLADCHEEKPDKRRQSTEVSKDLQYYPTPEKVVASILSNINIRAYDMILEPSCGCGRIMDGISKKFPSAIVSGIEVDVFRTAKARDKGHKVHTANFLETVPVKDYDHIIMNPPFYGKHYAKHIEHALKFLKDGGTLTAILPVTARYDHGLVDGRWSDLPVGSFRESGVNINTTVLTIHK